MLVSSGECREFCLRVDSSHAGQREDSPYHGINFKEEWKRIMHGNLFTFCVVLVQHIGCVQNELMDMFNGHRFQS